MARENTLEQKFGMHLRGILRTQTSEVTEQWAGRTSVPSGSSTVTVSTALVNSDSLIMVSEEVSSVGAIAVQSAGQLVVNSIVSGTSFSIARAGGDDAGWDATAMWLIIQT